MLVGRCQKIPDMDSATKAKKRPLSILLLTGGRADLALQPPQSRNLPIEQLRRVLKDLRICSSLATLFQACFTHVLAEHTKHLNLSLDWLLASMRQPFGGGSEYSSASKLFRTKMLAVR